ncbi:hypothetical protein G647_08912 [Cladophialophora carrionii CBS 160.54]|uniref:DUF1772 domain-containing protein n=1 Tax=Cladophialophora carrionii CBS 160.54 TaxID=1279043 RepID=V9D1Q6_9EURO|nr:uncharacterized protein G647_08912 [Cladophialophora carrionii CBS 160.54]ETI19897.1 hypothetical protein G647_08912 [Cladophialophora carrionii CBS 160.54]
MTALSLMAVPVLLETTSLPAQLLHQWVTMYAYGHRVLPGLAIVTCLIYLGVAFTRRTRNDAWVRYGLAGIVTVNIVPFTLIFMVSTNNTLFGLERDARVAGLVTTDIETGKELVTRWSRLHLMRSMLPLVGTVIGVTAVVDEVKM